MILNNKFEATKNFLFALQSLVLSFAIQNEVASMILAAISGVFWYCCWQSLNQPKIKMEGFKINTKDAPEEVKDLLKSLRNLSGTNEKCKDPHCPDCWGLADKDEPKI